MGDNKPGTKNIELLEGCSDWYLVEEAECTDSLDTLNDLEELFDNSDGSNISDLIDDFDEVDQGNSLELFNQQITEDCNKAIAELKRKYATPSPKKNLCANVDLSPRLQAVSISSKTSSKRRLFRDSGIEENEAEDSVEEQVESGRTNNDAGKNGGNDLLQLLQTKTNKPALLGKFKDVFGVSYKEIIRPFKNDKTMCEMWVVVVYAAKDELLESSKLLLEQHCLFILQKNYEFLCMYLLQFITNKCRDTVQKLMCSLLNVNECQLLCDPPKHRSTAAALFYYKCTTGNASYTKGTLPDWISNKLLVDHQAAASSDMFDFSEMVQWAFDHNFTEECTIAYEYALLASECANAAAWLNHNNQAKYVRDCAYMCRLYKRQEMKEMTMSQWIWKCCKKYEGEGDWKAIPLFLKYQEVNFISFLAALKPFLKSTPKQNCILFHGQPDTGKSYFVFSLIEFLQGKVVSFMNSKSHFWLQPFVECKIGLIDDVTYSCWTFMDVHMRTGLDGNTISIDSKHKAPIQMKLPPLLLTSNIDLHKENTLMYLHSRVKSFQFNKKMPLDENGEPVYKISHLTWKYFFMKLARQLELTPDDEGNGEIERPLRCSTRSPVESI